MSGSSSYRRYIKTEPILFAATSDFPAVSQSRPHLPSPTERVEDVTCTHNCGVQSTQNNLRYSRELFRRDVYEIDALLTYHTIVPTWPFPVSELSAVQPHSGSRLFEVRKRGEHLAPVCYCVSWDDENFIDHFTLADVRSTSTVMMVARSDPQLGS